MRRGDDIGRRGIAASRSLPWVLLLATCIVLLAQVIAAPQGTRAPAAKQPDAQATDGDAAPTAVPPGPAREMVGMWLEMARGSFYGRVAALLVALIVSALAYLAITVALNRARGRLEQQAERSEGAGRAQLLRVVTVVAMTHNVARWMLLAMAILWALATMGINILPLLTGVGFLGAAVAFGSQRLVADLVAGFFLLLEGQFAVGDYVSIAGSFGRVQAIGLRVTVLRDPGSQLYHIPNGTIGAVTVYDHPWVYFIVEVPLSEGEQAARLAPLADALAQELITQYSPLLVGADPCEIAPGAGDVTLVRLPLRVFPTRDWIATELIPTRVRRLLGPNGLSLADGLDIRVYSGLRPASGYAADAEP